MPRLFKGNPPVTPGWVLYDSVEGWDVYVMPDRRPREEIPHPWPYLYIKLVAHEPNPHKANYWLATYNGVLGRRHDAAVLMAHCPELADSLKKVMFRWFTEEWGDVPDMDQWLAFNEKRENAKTHEGS